VAEAMGAKQIVFVAKHTGGFCWWQTETSDYGIRNTPWRDGQGDVVADLAENRAAYEDLRAHPLDNAVRPALRFDPLMALRPLAAVAGITGQPPVWSDPGPVPAFSSGWPNNPRLKSYGKKRGSDHQKGERNGVGIGFPTLPHPPGHDGDCGGCRQE